MPWGVLLVLRLGPAAVAEHQQQEVLVVLLVVPLVLSMLKGEWTRDQMLTLPYPGRLAQGWQNAAQLQVEVQLVAWWGCVVPALLPQAAPC
jgi:hypothetical protein